MFSLIWILRWGIFRLTELRLCEVLKRFPHNLCKTSQALGFPFWKTLACGEIIKWRNVYGLVIFPRIVHWFLILFFFTKREENRNVYILFRNSGENDSNSISSYSDIVASMFFGNKAPFIQIVLGLEEVLGTLVSSVLVLWLQILAGIGRGTGLVLSNW